MQTRENARSELFRLLAHPIRRSALEALGLQETSVGRLANELGVTPSHLSQQLAILRRSGFVQSRREGSTVYYAVHDARVNDLLQIADAIVGSGVRHGARDSENGDDRGQIETEKRNK